MQRLQLFAWQSEQRGNDVHINSNPTQSALVHREYLEKKEVLKETSSASILEKYGGEKYLERVPRELLGGQTEEYVEYSRTGQVVKGRERAKARSKYDEDGRRRFSRSLVIVKRLTISRSQSSRGTIRRSGARTTLRRLASGVSHAATRS